MSAFHPFLPLDGVARWRCFVSICEEAYGRFVSGGRMYDATLTQSYFPAQGGPEPEPITIGEMLRRSVDSAPDRPALKELGYDGEIGRTWTYAELLTDARRLARALASRHAEGARVAVYANNVPEWVLLEVACGLAGVTLVTVNPAYQKRELKYVLEQSRSEALYYVTDFRGNPMKEIADAACDEIPAIRHRILLTDHVALFAGEDDGAERSPKPSDPAQIQYTSGTTGFPKGALLHHHGLVRNGIDVMTRGGVTANSSFVHQMPLFHTTGCAILVLGGLGLGATILLAPMFDPATIVRVIEREQTDFILGVPTMLVALIDEVEKSGRDVSSIAAHHVRRRNGRAGAMQEGVRCFRRADPDRLRANRGIAGHYPGLVRGLPGGFDRNDRPARGTCRRFDPRSGHQLGRGNR